MKSGASSGGGLQHIEAADPETGAPEQASGPRRYPCEKCGAQLEYTPGVGKLTCSYCSHQNVIPESAEEIKELDLVATLDQLADAAPTESHITVRCDACGAEIDQPASAAAFACPYCGANIVATGLSRDTIRPQALLPFRIETNEATARYRHWLRKLWFAPLDLKRYARVEGRLRGVYTPFWTYDARTIAHYTGRRGDHYYVTVGSGKNRRRARRTRWRSVSGTVWNRFNDVLVLASRSLPKKHADKLEPWGLAELTPYDDAFLSGFLAETYQVSLREGFEEAKAVMQEIIRQTARGDIGGDEQRIHSLDVAYRDLSFKYILLPIWISAYRYKDKTYRFLINGVTGEVQGERPWSIWQIALVVLAGLAVLGVVVWLIMTRG